MARQRRFRMEVDSLQSRFMQSRAKIQFYGGGFANGKTSASCVKALELSKAYPGSNGLIARSTYPKLNDTIRKEFLKWCPESAIKSFPRSQNASNTCTMTNGTTINFRYIAQQGKGKGESTSNLLSATYDWIIVDQMEDPEISHKDFLDLLGRLRGMTPYIGDDFTMPRTGPRYFIITCNPTRNWIYKKIIKPYHDFLKDGKYHEGLLCETDEDGSPVLDHEGRPTPTIEVFEGATYENAANLPPDFIASLEASYHGQMRERFLLGKWAAYEGLVYAAYDDEQHRLSKQSMLDYLWFLRQASLSVRYIEGYDHGLVVPSCYLFGFVDPWGNVFILDGFHESEQLIDTSIAKIRAIRDQYIGRGQWDVGSMRIWSDPSLFKRAPTGKKTVGRTVAQMFWDDGGGVKLAIANNNIMSGINKVQSYLALDPRHKNPITGVSNAPRIYFSEDPELAFIDEEFTEYRWAKDTSGENIDKPHGTNDHAMDALKYLMSARPIATDIKPMTVVAVPAYLRWHESTQTIRSKRHRYQ